MALAQATGFDHPAPPVWLPLIAFIALAYGISWLIWMPLWLPAFGVQGLPVLPFNHAMGAFGPLLAALVVTAYFDGWSGVARWGGRLFRLGPRLWVAAVALFGPFALLLIGFAVAYTWNGAKVDFAAIGRSSEFPAFSAVGFLLYNILTFGLGEEAGWRGFALPRLQSRYSALAASAIIAVIWALWHLPLFAYRPGYVGMGVGGIIGWLVSLATGAVLTTTLFNASKGSILVVAAFHAAIDVAFTSSGASLVVINTCGALITLAGIAVVVVYGRANLWREGRMVWTERGLVEHA